MGIGGWILVLCIGVPTTAFVAKTAVGLLTPHTLTGRLLFLKELERRGVNPANLPAPCLAELSEYSTRMYEVSRDLLRKGRTKALVAMVEDVENSAQMVAAYLGGEPQIFEGEALYAILHRYQLVS